MKIPPKIVIQEYTPKFCVTYRLNVFDMYLNTLACSILATVQFLKSFIPFTNFEGKSS